jgi:hypothetical protein
MRALPSASDFSSCTVAGTPISRQAGRPKVIQSTDVFVDSNRILYCTDSNAGLYVME